MARPVFQGLEKLLRRNHLVQNLRAYFILYVITFKRRMCLQEKIELSSMLQITKALLNQYFHRYLFSYKDKAAIKIPKKFQRWQKAGILLLRDGIWHPIPPHGYASHIQLVHICDLKTFITKKRDLFHFFIQSKTHSFCYLFNQ